MSEGNTALNSSKEAMMNGSKFSMHISGKANIAREASIPITKLVPNKPANASSSRIA